VVGAAVAGRDQGEVVLGGAEAVEAFSVPVGGERLGMHLGGVLSATPTEAGLALSIGVRDHRVGEAVLPNRPGAEVALGPWSVFALRTEPAGAPGGARLRVTPRAGGAPRDFSVRVGNQIALEDGTRIGLNRVSADFGRALGPAAQITPVAPGARDGVGEGRWIFTEAPDLDARLGDDAWAVQLLGLEAAPRSVLGVRRRGPLAPLFAGLAFVLPYAATGVFLGPEFPSMLGGLIGLAIVTSAARFGFLVPKKTWDFAPADKWPSEWLGTVEMKLDELTAKPMSALRAWLPYVLVGALLVISRVFPEVSNALKAVVVNFPDLLGEAGVSANFQPLYLPGGILVAVVLATFFLHGMKARDLGKAVKESSSVLLSAGFVLLFTVPMVRILINSGVNAAELSSMPILMARWVADSVGGIYPLLAPSIGALGAFIAGSNTVSNMMFSQFQFGVASSLGISSALIVAVQAIGAAAGNMVAIHNVVAASATVGLLGREGSILRKTVWPTLYYVLFTGLIAMFAVYVLGVSDPLMAS
jgi:lactate permease